MSGKKRLIVLAILAGMVVAAIVRTRQRAASLLDPERARRLRDALHASYHSTLAAFEPSDGTSDADGRDARAAADVRALEEAIDACRDGLSKSMSAQVAVFVEAVRAAQVQLMAFAVNRKNRGLPDAAGLEAEARDHSAFKREAEPLLGELGAMLA